jgi:hypothetical protein
MLSCYSSCSKGLPCLKGELDACFFLMAPPLTTAAASRLRRRPAAAPRPGSTLRRCQFAAPPRQTPQNRRCCRCWMGCVSSTSCAHLRCHILQQAASIWALALPPTSEAQQAMQPKQLQHSAVLLVLPFLGAQWQVRPGQHLRRRAAASQQPSAAVAPVQASLSAAGVCSAAVPAGGAGRGRRVACFLAAHVWLGL